ncbi:hypothetical protein B0H11DRAFT_2242945 [Mycena galericulata]|nr:hypothetical protein B0H11DRAFT_2242945 [Mycena galericulata]
MTSPPPEQGEKSSKRKRKEESMEAPRKATRHYSTDSAGLDTRQAINPTTGSGVVTAQANEQEDDEVEDAHQENPKLPHTPT